MNPYTKHDIDRRIERIQTAIVWRLPRWVIRWAVVRGAVLTTGDYPADVSAGEIIQRLLP